MSRSKSQRDVDLILAPLIFSFFQAQQEVRQLCRARDPLPDLQDQPGADPEAQPRGKDLEREGLPLRRPHR